MKRTTERGKADNIYKSYQKQEKPVVKAKSGTSKTMESNISKSKNVPKKAKEDDDSEDDGDDELIKSEELGHEMTAVRKRMDVQQMTGKASYGTPIKEMPTVQERQVEISIDDAIGTLRTGIYVNI